MNGNGYGNMGVYSVTVKYVLLRFSIKVYAAHIYLSIHRVVCVCVFIFLPRFIFPRANLYLIF